MSMQQEGLRRRGAIKYRQLNECDRCDNNLLNENIKDINLLEDRDRHLTMDEENLDAQLTDTEELSDEDKKSKKVKDKNSDIEEKDDEEKVSSEIESINASDESEPETDINLATLQRQLSSSLGRPIRQMTLVSEGKNGVQRSETKDLDEEGLEGELDEPTNAQEACDSELEEISEEEDDEVEEAIEASKSQNENEEINYDVYLQNNFQHLSIGAGSTARDRTGSDISDVTNFLHAANEESELSAGLTEEENMSDRELNNPNKKGRKNRNIPILLENHEESDSDDNMGPNKKVTQTTIKTKSLLLSPKADDGGLTDVEDFDIDEESKNNGNEDEEMKTDSELYTFKEVISEISLEENAI